MWIGRVAGTSKETPTAGNCVCPKSPSPRVELKPREGFTEHRAFHFWPYEDSIPPLSENVATGYHFGNEQETLLNNRISTFDFPPFATVKK